MKIRDNLERISMEQKALALPYSEEDIKQYFPEREHLTLKIINSFVEENQGELYFDVANRSFGINGEIIHRSLFGIFDKENEEKFLELMKYADVDLGPMGHVLYSEEGRNKIFDKNKAILNNFEEKGQKVLISRISSDLYLILARDKEGSKLKDRDVYDLRILDDSKVLNEMWFNNSRIIYTIEDKIY